MAPRIQRDDIKPISDSFNALIGNADTERDELSKLLLTIYTPVSSGLFLLSTQLKLVSSSQRILFKTVAATSILIVFTILVQKLGNYLIAKSQAQQFIDHVNKTGKHLSEPMYGKEWQSRLVSATTFLGPLLFAVNLLATLLFVLHLV